MAAHTTGPPHEMEFDLSRLDLKRYSNLVTNKERLAFVSLVRDYMAFARSDQTQGQPSPMELRAAEIFADLIRSEAGWPLARQTIPEFRQPPDDFSLLPPLVKHALEAVSNAGLLRPPDVIQIGDTQRFEEDLLWKKWRANIEYIGLLNGTRADATRQKEIDETLEHLAEIEQSYRDSLQKSSQS